MCKYNFHNHQRLTSLPPKHIFVFGSNEAGIHGAGAAKDAVDYFGAKYGISEGLCGQSYAVPTKDYSIATLPISKIGEYVNNLLHFASCNEDLIFIVTPIGCGLAGYEPKEIAPLFTNCPNNVILPELFKEYL